MSDSLDTSLVLRFIINDEPEKRETVIKLLSSEKTHHLSDLAISEVIYVLERVYMRPRREVVDLLAFFLARFSEEIIFNRDLLSVVLPYYLEHPKLSFNDCCLSYYAHKNNNEPLYTFDKKLAAQSPYAELLK